MSSPSNILRIAVPTPLYRIFDYLPHSTQDLDKLKPGVRVRVPFGRTKSIGVLVELAETSDIEHGRLKPILECLDEHPALPPDILELVSWASNYYHYPIGEAINTALPAALRKGLPDKSKPVTSWCLTPEGKSADQKALKRAPRQAAVHICLQQYPEGAKSEKLQHLPGDWRGGLQALIKRGWVTKQEISATSQAESQPSPDQSPPHLPLNPYQQEAVDNISASLGKYQTFLLHGVTGSGKTEVYLQVIDTVLGAGQQVLVLVPEIGLTPQLVQRFQQRFQLPITVFHSGLSDSERLEAWLAARDGSASIILGTRSAIFTPLKNPGLIIVDEEHDVSLKQQDGFRYSARDLAVIRGRLLKVPVVLGSATPSLESMHNAAESRYTLQSLPDRAGDASHASIELLDVRAQPMDEGLSHKLLQRMRQHLEQGNQVLLFLNRRGYAPVLMCHECGWTAECDRCDTHMTLHKQRNRLCCHHCGADRAIEKTCPNCTHEELKPIGQGTQRTEQALQEHFPDITIARIDRDSTRRKGSMETMLENALSGKSQILIGTQLLAKGHHFPNVTMVGILDTDQGLFSADFRGTEKMVQLALQVAGRAGRAEKPGQVLIQTQHPDHPMLGMLSGQNYNLISDVLLQERKQACLPPFSNLALLRAEAADYNMPQQFLQHAKEMAAYLDIQDVEFMGPVPAPMERRAGRYRAQLLLQSENRPALHRLLKQWAPSLEKIKTARKVRWSLDVDPLDMF